MSSSAEMPPGLVLQKSVPPPDWRGRTLRLYRAVAITGLVLSSLPLMYLYSFLKAIRILSASRAARLRAAGTSFWMRGILAVMGVRVSIRGKVPAGGVLLVPNHQSYMDIFVLLSCMPAIFVANSGVRRWPGFGHLTAHLGTLYIDRTKRRMMKRVLPLIEKHLRWGMKVAVFLETTTSDGSRVLPFRAGLLEAAIQMAVPCMPIAIRYTAPRDSVATSACINWWGGMRFFSHLWRLLALRRIEAEVVVGPAVSTQANSDRKMLSVLLHEQVCTYLFGGAAQQAAMEGSPEKSQGNSVR